MKILHVFQGRGVMLEGVGKKGVCRISSKRLSFHFVAVLIPDREYKAGLANGSIPPTLCMEPRQ